MHPAASVARLLLALASVSAGAQDSTRILKRVDDHYNHLKTLRTRYVEHYAGMGMNRSESGTLLLAKPGRMRWSYDTPVGKLFVLDGKNAWSYTPGDAQVEKIAAKKLDDLRSPLRFLLGHTQLAKELEEVTVTPAGTGFRIAGIPRGMEQRVKSLTLAVDGAARIQTMRLEEIDGASTEFTFTGMTEDIPIPATEFIFHVPSGVGVVDGLPPV